MLHFIPAWYRQNEWCENEQKWYVRRMHTEFDDTVKQIQLFNRSRAYPYQILLLGFSPNFRHFLHRQGVFHAPYWSCFDAIQEIRRKKAQILSYHNMNWPPHVEFLYTPFSAVALIKGEKYAQIEFGEDGNPIQIDIYKKDKIIRRNLYDDRGFVSGTIIYEEEKPLYQDYLMDNGIWKLRHFQGDGHVEINPGHPNYLLIYKEYEKTQPFSKMRYDSIEEVIREVFAAYWELTDAEDIFCVAMQERHVELLRKTLQEVSHERKFILSFFGSRYCCEEHPEVSDLLKKAGFIITDSQQNSKRVQGIAGSETRNIADIPPFDTRVDFGISQQLSVQNILVPVDGIEDGFLMKLTVILGKYLQGNENARVHLLTRQADYGREKYLLDKVCGYLEKADLPAEWAEEPVSFVAENNVDCAETVPQKFFVRVCVDELSVTKCVREQRILVDMRKHPELYLQITALSAGIPQIVRSGTRFIQHGQNGFVLREMNMLVKVLNYYLGSLAHWNEAVVSSYRLGRKYTADVLIEKWKEVIERIG